VDARRSAEIKEDRRDLFSGLVEAADNDRDINEALTEPELLCKCQSSPDPAHEQSSHSPYQRICSSSFSLDMR
jgi:hypothetical protein